MESWRFGGATWTVNCAVPMVSAAPSCRIEAPADRPVLDPGVMAAEVHQIGGGRGPDQGAMGPRHRGLLDRDAAGRRPAQEHHLGAEHPGVFALPPRFECDHDEFGLARVAEQVGVAGGRLADRAVDPEPEHLDSSAGDLEPLPRPQPADPLVGAVEPGPGPSRQVDGIEAARVEV